MKIKIKVTKEILEQSAMCGTGDMIPSSNCAIALAVRDIFPEAKVLNTRIYPFGNYLSDVHFAHGMDYFTRRFDSMHSSTRSGLMPFHFYLDVPDAVIDQIGISEVHRILKESKTLELV